ncbi:DoxX family protein [Streptomyces sp. YIM 98790]|uniref:DoxX family protein n=1 Tax=Streptomyces sp. YIM 98790 TaxID=2689077 RepID=UPI001FB7321F|nr:DoxX family protein [Streptomyces sp. YIM 98790]
MEPLPRSPSPPVAPPRAGRLAALCRRHSVAALRMLMGLLFLYFGGMKLIPAASPAEEMAGRTMEAITFGLVPAAVSLPLLGVLEVLIGTGLVTGLLPRLTLTVFFVHMSGTFLALAVLAGEMWSDAGPFPTLPGQYVLKNLVLLAAGVVIAAQGVPDPAGPPPAAAAAPAPQREPRSGRRPGRVREEQPAAG